MPRRTHALHNHQISRLRRRNQSISPRRGRTLRSCRLRSTSSLHTLNDKSDFQSNTEQVVLAAKGALPIRLRFTNDDDYAILDYIISHDLLEKVRGWDTWAALETAGVTRHTASSMRCRFFKNIIYHFSEVLQCTTEGRLKYSDPNVVKKCHLQCLAISSSPKKNPSTTSLSDLSYFTNDSSPHDIDQQIVIPASSSRRLSMRLVDYDDTQPDPSPLKQSDVSKSSRNVLKTQQKCGRTFTRRRLFLSGPSGRLKGLRLRRHEPLDTGGKMSSEVIIISDTPPASPQSDPPRHQSRLLNRSSQMILNSSFRVDSPQVESISVESDSSLIKKRGRKRGRTRRRCSQVDLDTAEATKGSEVHDDLVNLEMVPDTPPEAGPSGSVFMAGTRQQSLPSQPVSSGASGDAPLMFPFMESQPTVSNEVLLSRTVAYTRKLDYFARNYHLSSTDAALLLHATSGDFEAASSYLETGKRPLWFPSDDTLLLSTSVTDIHAVISKFGPTEVSRRLFYLADRTLFS